MIKFETVTFLTWALSNVIMMAPKALAPYMYAMRYRELAKVIKSFFFVKKLNRVEPLC